MYNFFIYCFAAYMRIEIHGTQIVGKFCEFLYSLSNVYGSTYELLSTFLFFVGVSSWCNG